MTKMNQDLCQNILCKFLLNLPKEQLQDSSRLCHNAEKAFYYYLDYVINDKEMDWKKQRKEFFTNLKEYAPSYLKLNPNQLSQKLLQNKPVCGAIIFNKDNTKVLVIRVGERLGFPKGKQNQGQTLEQCAVREVDEETGIKIQSKLQQRIRIEFTNHHGKICFFVARGVPEEERIKIDTQQIDQVIWMKIQDVRKKLDSSFVERSKIAWTMYEKDFAGKSQQYAPKYFKKDCEELDFQADPLRNFKLQKKKLHDIMFEELPLKKIEKTK